ncbi:MAG: hypothetical protein ACI3V5_02275 [Faecousia sp.]
MTLYTDDQLFISPLLLKELLPNLFAILAGVFFGNPHGKNGLRIRNMLAYTDGDHVKHVCGRLKHELQRVFDSDDITRQNLMLPIIGYNLIVHNEFQYEAVCKRVRNDMKGPHSTKPGDYPYNVWGRNNPYSVTREEDIPFSNKYELAEKRLEQMVALRYLWIQVACI